MITEHDIQSIAAEIASRFNPMKIILFGSHARGTARDDSDIDLLVVLPMTDSRRKVAGLIRASITGKYPIDIVVRAPEEMSDPASDLLIMDAISSGKELYSAAA